MKNEGTVAVWLTLVLYCFNVDTYSFVIVSFHEIFVFHIIGCGTPGLVPDDGDVIDVKVEPVEVCRYIDNDKLFISYKGTYSLYKKLYSKQKKIIFIRTKHNGHEKKYFLTSGHNWNLNVISLLTPLTTTADTLKL